MNTIKYFYNLEWKSERAKNEVIKYLCLKYGIDFNLIKNPTL